MQKIIDITDIGVISLTSVIHRYHGKEREMKRLCITIPEDLAKELQKTKKKDFEKSYSEIIRELMAEALKQRNEKKAAA